MRNSQFLEHSSRTKRFFLNRRSRSRSGDRATILRIRRAASMAPSLEDARGHFSRQTGCLGPTESFARIRTLSRIARPALFLHRLELPSHQRTRSQVASADAPPCVAPQEVERSRVLRKESFHARGTHPRRIPQFVARLVRSRISFSGTAGNALVLQDPLPVKSAHGSARIPFAQLQCRVRRRHHAPAPTDPSARCGSCRRTTV